jgi:hypothetical protein
MRVTQRCLLFVLLSTVSLSAQTLGQAGSDELVPANSDVLPLAFEYRAEVQEQIDIPAVLIANFETPASSLASSPVSAAARDAWLLPPADALALAIPLRC